MASSPGAGKEAIRPKRKRNLPGMPDPDAEVIALSPKSLMETNKYVCDICGKGFQRDQNLQLHRRGHNLPWKLKQRPTGNEPKKKVYICPEPSCAHHDPTRALGDLTGIKKHFCRKHGEKKFKCDKCSKCYAVLCDWKAHSKICGTREYPCDCGTVFSRRDSFLTHRAFCDALAQESARSSHGEVLNLVNPKPPLQSSSSPPPQPPTPSTAVLSPVLSIQSSELPENQSGYSLHKKESPPVSRRGGGSSTSSGGGGNLVWNTRDGFSRTQETTECVPAVKESNNQNNTEEAAFVGLMGLSMPPSSMHSQSSPMMMSLSLSTTPFYPPPNSASVFLYDDNRARHFTRPPPPAALSATALLQKAAEIGSKSSTTFLQGLGLAMSSVEEDYSSDANPEKKPLLSSSGLSLGLHSSSSRAAMIFGNKPPTLDFLGVGCDQTPSSSADQYPVLMNSMNNGIGRRDQFGIDASSSFTGFLGGHSWDDTSSDQKPAAGFL